MQTHRSFAKLSPHSVSAVAASGLFLAVAILAPASAGADRFASVGSGWQRYSNDRYGTEFEFPAHVFDVAPPSETGDGQQFLSRDATLEIFATENAWKESASGLRRRVLEREQGEVTYAPSGQNWFVLSGFRGDQIFYEKYLLRDGVLHAFGVEFPASAKPVYAPIIERIEDSFRVGPRASPANLRGGTPPEKQDDRSKPAEDPLVIY